MVSGVWLRTRSCLCAVVAELSVLAVVLLNAVVVQTVVVEGG